jgi:hypothetical protein
MSKLIIALFVFSLFIGGTPAHATKDVISKAEKEIAHLRYEVGIGYDANGTELFRLKGDGDGVYPTEEQNTELEGGMFTHNHPPTACAALSIRDIGWGASIGLYEMHAVGYGDGLLVLSVMRNMQAFRTADLAHVNKVLMAHWRTDSCYGLHVAWKLLAKEYGAEYVVVYK